MKLEKSNFFSQSCEKDVLIQSKSGCRRLCAMHAEARGASGRYTQEKSAEVYLWPKPVEAGILDRGKKRRNMQKDAKRQKKEIFCERKLDEMGFLV